MPTKDLLTRSQEMLLNLLNKAKKVDLLNYHKTHQNIQEGMGAENRWLEENRRAMYRQIHRREPELVSQSQGEGGEDGMFGQGNSFLEGVTVQQQPAGRSSSPVLSALTGAALLAGGAGGGLLAANALGLLEPHVTQRTIEPQDYDVEFIVDESGTIPDESVQVVPREAE